MHVIDDQQPIALVKMRTVDGAGDDHAPRQLIRYQLDNHRLAAALELSATAAVISYEAYSAYGNTTNQAVTIDLDISATRYRFTSQERD